MTVPAFSLPAVLPGAPPSSMGAGAAALSDKGGLFEGLLAGAIQTEQGERSAAGAALDDQFPAEAVTDEADTDETTVAADASLTLMMFAPAAMPLTVPTTPAPSDTVEADLTGGSTATGLGAQAFGPSRSPVVAGTVANDLLDASGLTTPGDVASTVPSKDAPGQVPPGRLSDLAGLYLASENALAGQPAAARPESLAAVQPAVVAPAQVAAAPAAANDVETVEAAALATPPVKTTATDGETRRAAGAARADRRDAASRAGPVSTSPFAPKSDLLAATVAAATSPATGEADVGSGAAPDLAVLDATEAPETGQPAPIAETHAQAAQATAAAIDAAAVRGSPETVAKMAADIVRKLDGQSTRFDLQLDPHGMGKVDVAIEIGRDGKLTAAMSFDSARSAADLRGRAGELRLALEQAGFDIAEGGLSFDLADQNAGFSGREAGQQERAWNGRAFQRAQSGADDADLSLAATPSTPSRWTRSGVDIRI